MDFIEDHIINCSVIPEDLKLKLIYSPEMAPYAFIGALFHFSLTPMDSSSQRGQDSNTEKAIEQEEEECEADIDIDELLELYHNLSEKDMKSIVKSNEIMDRLDEIIDMAYKILKN
jgi:hypothetical protein